MVYDACLLITSLIYAWVAGDVLFSRRPRRFPGIGVAALAISLWSLGELFVRHAATEEGLLAARRVLFLGVCTLGPAWLIGTAQAVRARWLGEWLPVLVGLPPFFVYATLYTGSTLFLDASQPTVLARGPLFAWHAVFSWGLVFAGFATVARHLVRLGSPWPMFASLGAAAAVPFLANIVYVTTGFPALDPTPVLLGGVAIGLRFILLDTGLAPSVQTLARREVLDQLGVGLVVADAFGEVVEANPAARRMSGLDDLLGISLDEVVDRAERHPLRVIEVTSSELMRSGIRFGTALVMEDRTEVRTAERRLEIATRFEALGFLISGVTHQISNPLSYVRGNLGLVARVMEALREQPDLVERLPHAARRIAREGDSIVRDAIAGADRITTLVRRLGTFARDEARAPAAPVDVAMVTHQAVDLAGLGRAPDQIRISHEETLPMVFTREQDLLQILLHLLINAVQAGGKDGVIEIELRAGQGHVTVDVLDRGPGIAPDLLPHVFDPFFTTKDGEGNQGLGLSLSYDLARQNGGLLEASQRDGGGAAFRLWLPVSEEEPGEA